MKKIIFILLTGFFLASCESFLDTENLTEKTTGNFPATEIEANQMLTSIYANLLFEDPEVSSSIYTAQLAGDDCLGGNLSGSNNCATNFLMYTANLNGLSPLWNRCYKIVNRANSALGALDNVTSWSSQSERNRHFGEAYFLRAFAYYELAQMFGGVPLHTNTEANNLPRASIDEVYGLIAADLKEAIELMPNRIYPEGSALAGHATKYAAEALMARVFLFYTGRYAQAELPGGISKAQVITWIDDCVNNSGHNLVSEQRNLWPYTNEASENNTEGFRYKYVTAYGLKWEGNSSIETVFASKHKLKGNDWTYTWFSNTVAQFFSPSNDNNAFTSGDGYPFGSGWGAGPVSPAMVNEWQSWDAQQSHINGAAQDPRLSGSIWSYKALDPNVTGNVLLDRKLDPNEPDYTVSYRYYEQTGYHQKKYINVLSRYNGQIASFGLQMYPDIAPGAISLSLNNISDVIHIRFADVLLMQSELKEDATGLNRVRQRSNLAPIGYSLQALKNERRYELAFESIRWWDLLRWSGPSLDEAGDALNKQTGFTLINAAVVVPMVQYDYKARLKKTDGYWPVPQNEIDLSKDVLTQNPGWDASAQFTDWNNL
jgi:hypothetical protein